MVLASRQLLRLLLGHDLGVGMCGQLCCTLEYVIASLKIVE